jgi:mono/diheme cytochrome c family protein
MFKGVTLKGVILGAALTLVVALIGAYSVVQSGLIPANADAKPGRLEDWIARTSLHATLSRDAPKSPNPVPLSDQNLLTGIDLYAQNCAVCHGSASGNASTSPIAKGLYPGVPQLATEGVEDDPEGDSFWRIKHGVRLTGMPAFGDSLSDQQIWTLALFLKQMDKLPASVQQTWLQVRNWPIATASQTGTK